eukprot:2067614-Amphidinium_carterae.1
MTDPCSGYVTFVKHCCTLQKVQGYLTLTAFYIRFFKSLCHTSISVYKQRNVKMTIHFHHGFGLLVGGGVVVGVIVVIHVKFTS